MATIDSLLQTVLQYQMEALLLEPDRLPRLQRDGKDFQGARRELGGEAIRRLVAEVAPAGVEPARGEWTFDHRYRERTFRFAGRGGPDGPRVRVALLPEGAAPAARPAAPAAAAGSGKPGSPEAGATATAAPGTGAPATERPAPGEPAAGPPSPGGTPGSTAAAGASPSPRPGASQDVRDVRPLLLEMLERGASDLHLSTGQLPRLRVDGELQPMRGYFEPEPEKLQEALLGLAPPRNRKEYLATHDTDFGLELPGKGRFRVNFFRDRLGMAAVFRQIPTEIPSFEELGLPSVLRDVVHLSRGLVLVTGPTGSGKSTTLAAVLDLINRSRADHIITIEDPVEFVHPSKRCLVHQREVGTHTDSFAAALRASLREDPDVVLVGELRDLETTAIAIKTAETGHLVFGTLHTTSAPATVERLIDQFPEGQQAQIRLMLASSLKAVISQVLVKRNGGGRAAAFEILLNTAAVANLIREGKVFQVPSAMQTGRAQGMQSLDEALVKLVEDDVTSAEEAYLKANDKKDVLARLRAAGADLSFLEAGSGLGRDGGKASPPLRNVG